MGVGSGRSSGVEEETGVGTEAECGVHGGRGFGSHSPREE